MKPYHVTEDNYHDLQTALQTDFESMGLSSNSSYIITFSGDENQKNRSIANPLPEQTTPNFGGDNTFTYKYNGNEYKMRYAIVTSTSAEEMVTTTTHAIQKTYWLSDKVSTIFETALISVADNVFEGIPVGTIASLLLTNPSDNAYVELAPSELTVFAQSIWTLQYIQVWDSNYSRWYACQSAEYVTTHARCAGYLYNAKTNSSEWYSGPEQSATIYSSKYYLIEQRKADAMRAYDLSTIYANCIYEIDFIVAKQDIEITYDVLDAALFTHKRSFPILLPPSD